MEFDINENIQKVHISVPDTKTIMNSLTMIRKELNYELVSTVGSGSFGHTYLMMKEGTREEVAMKFVPKKNTTLMEIEAWPRIKHRNILRVQETIFIPSELTYVFVMPLHRTTLHRALKTEHFINDPKGLQKLKMWFFGVLCGLEYLHQRRLCHCDLKANNILLDHDLNAVICDFSFLNTTTQPVTRYGLPYIYRPPEVCYSRGLNIAAEGKPFDLWAMGMLALNVLTGEAYTQKMEFIPPVWSRNVYPVIYSIIKINKLTKYVRRVLPSVKITTETVEQMRNFVTSFLRLDICYRIPASVAKTHEFLGGHFFEMQPDSIWIRKVDRENIDRIVSWYVKADYTVERLDGKVTKEFLPNVENSEHKFTYLKDDSEASSSDKIEIIRDIDRFSLYDSEDKTEEFALLPPRRYSDPVHSSCSGSVASELSGPSSELGCIIEKSRELLAKVETEIRDWRVENGLISSTEVNEVEINEINIAKEDDSK